MGALELALSVFSQLPGLISAGANVIALINSTKTTLTTAKAENRDPTPAEWDALNAQIDDLRKQLHAP